MIAWPDVPNRFGGRCVLCRGEVPKGAGVAVKGSGLGHALVCLSCSSQPGFRERVDAARRSKVAAFQARKEASPVARCFICDRKRRKADMEYLVESRVYRCRHHARR